MHTKTETYSQLYNQPLSFFEIISDKQLVKTLVEDIKADKNINIEIQRFIYQTNFHPELDAKLKRQRAELAQIDDYLERLKLNERIQDTESELRRYKIDILETSAILYNLKEESLAEVKQSFFAGNISEANTQLKSYNLWQAQSLLLQKLEIEKKLEEVYEKLVDNANEYQVKAQLTSLNLEIEMPEDRLQKAIEFFEKGKVSAERSRKEEYIGSYYFSYGYFLQENNFFNEAIAIYDKILNEYGYLIQSGYLEWAPIFATIYNNLANIEIIQKKATEARQHYEEALNIYLKLLEHNSLMYSFLIATTYNNLGTLYYELDSFTKAESLYNKALTILKKFPKNNEPLFVTNLGNTYANFAVLYTKINNIEAAIENYKKALELYEAMPQEHKFQSSMAHILRDLGIQYKKQGKVNEAEKYYLKVLIIEKELVSKNPHIYSHSLSETLHSLGNLYKSIQKFDEAESKFKEALVIKRNLAKVNPEIYLVDVASTLNDLGLLLIDRHRCENIKTALWQAEEALKETLKIKRENPDISEDETQISIYKTLHNLAILHKNRDEFKIAEKEYESALEIIRKLAVKNPQVYSTELGAILYSISLFYLLSMPNKLKSVYCAREAIQVLLPFADRLPDNKKLILSAGSILSEWRVPI